MLLKPTLLRLIGALFIILALPGSPGLANDDGPVIYRVVKDDTIYNISRRFLTSQAAGRQVQRINNIRNPRRIPIDKRLRIPRGLLAHRDITLSVVSFSGTVTIGGQQVGVGTTLNEGQIVATAQGSFVSFQANIGGARFTMPSNSAMKLEVARQYILYDILDVDFGMVRGRGTIRSPQLKAQDRLRTRTPVATTAVRGTVYRVGYLEEEGLSLTEVVEGNVNVAVGEESADTGAGFGLASTEAGIGEAESLLPAVEFVEPGNIQTGESLAFNLVPLGDAQSYRVQVARDAGFLDIVAETISPTSAVAFPELPDGRYFVQARGIAASRLEGNSQPYSFRRKRLGVAGSSEPSPLLDGFLFKWVAVGEGPSTFAFQLWNKDRPADLIVDETGLVETSLVLTALDPGTYEWRVAVMQADAEDGLIKVWGAPESLVVSD